MAPKKKSKPSKNGFFLFMLEIKQSRKLTMQEAQDIAGPLWKDMPPEARRPYNEQALAERERYRNGKEVKYTSDGFKIDDLRKEEEDKERKEEEMRVVTKDRIENGICSKTIHDDIFFIIHMNKLIYHSSVGKYYIGEVAIAPFSLMKGVDRQNVFHRIVRPGRLPLGYQAEVKINSQNTHELAALIFDKEPFICNMENVFCDLIHFITQPQYKNKSDAPILYAHERDMEMVENVIFQWCYDYGYTQSIKIHNLQYMFFVLRNAVAGRGIWPTDTYSYSKIEKDGYCHVPNISCDYHEKADKTTYCSKSIVTRCAYTICDFCCGDLGISLKPDIHVPKNSIIKTNLPQRHSESDIFGKRYLSQSPTLEKSEASSSFHNFNPIDVSSSLSRTATEISEEFDSFDDEEETVVKSIDFSKLKFPKKGADIKNK